VRCEELRGLGHPRPEGLSPQRGATRPLGGLADGASPREPPGRDDAALERRGAHLDAAKLGGEPLRRAALGRARRAPLAGGREAPAREAGEQAPRSAPGFLARERAFELLLELVGGGVGLGLACAAVGGLAGGLSDRLAHALELLLELCGREARAVASTRSARAVALALAGARLAPVAACAVAGPALASDAFLGRVLAYDLAKAPGELGHPLVVGVAHPDDLVEELPEPAGVV